MRGADRVYRSVHGQNDACIPSSAMRLDIELRTELGVILENGLIARCFHRKLPIDMEMAAVKDLKDLSHGRRDATFEFIPAPPRSIGLSMEHLERW